MSETKVRIGKRPVSQDDQPFIVAEVSANHLGDFDRAVAILKAAAEAGADAVKLQTFRPDTITLDSDADPFVVQGTLWHGRRLYDLYAEAMTPWEWTAPLMALASELGMQLFSSPFDASAVEHLAELDAPAYKIASPELIDLPLIQRVAQTGKPVIMSTGMATLEEIETAMNAFEQAGGHGIVLLKCVSAYPAPLEEMNLLTIPDMAQRFGVPVGLSDHTLGATCAVAGVALGACVVEKHLTLARQDGGPDGAFSTEPGEFAEMVRQSREAFLARGRVAYGPTGKQSKTLAYRRSLWVVEDIAAGAPFTPQNVRSLRPANGLNPGELPRVLGKHATRSIAKGTPLSWEFIEEK